MNSETILKPRKWLILPIEGKVREFDAKLFLSCVAAENGLGVILGHQHAILQNWRKMPRGIVIDKSIVKPNLKKFNRYRSGGNRVAAFCEEGLLLANEQDYLNRKIYPATLDTIDMFYAWGENQARVVRSKVPEIEAKMVITGNPRFDLLRREMRDYFSSQSEKIRAEHGRFLLINTNFASYNNIRGTETALKIQKRDGKIGSFSGEQLYSNFMNFKKEMYHAFIDMVVQLALSLPNIKVIVRPHPSENHANWKEATRQYNNVEVIHSGNVINWILAAEVIVQNGCTTGIESFLLGKPTISYMPFQAKVYEKYLPDVISRRVENINGLLGEIRNVLDGNPLESESARREKRKLIRKFIHNVDGRLASDLIVERLTALDLKPDVFKGSYYLQAKRKISNWPTESRYFLRNIKDRFVSGKTLAIRKKSEESLASTQKRILKQIFPGLELSEVENGIRSFQTVTGRFAAVKTFPYYKNCFVITA